MDIVVQSLNEKYSMIKINSKPARKENSINVLKEKNAFEKVIVCGSGKTDIPLIKQADFSFCLNTAPDYVKEAVDVVIKDDPEEVLKTFEKIYYSYNVEKTINRIKKKCFK